MMRTIHYFIFAIACCLYSCDTSSTDELHPYSEAQFPEISHISCTIDDTLCILYADTDLVDVNYPRSSSFFALGMSQKDLNNPDSENLIGDSLIGIQFSDGYHSIIVSFPYSNQSTRYDMKRCGLNAQMSTASIRYNNGHDGLDTLYQNKPGQEFSYYHTLNDDQVVDLDDQVVGDLEVLSISNDPLQFELSFEGTLYKYTCSQVDYDTVSMVGVYDVRPINQTITIKGYINYVSD